MPLAFMYSHGPDIPIWANFMGCKWLTSLTKVMDGLGPLPHIF